MSCNYADGLSPYHDKGQLGLEEKFDSKSVVTAKVSLLTKWINEANHVVIHTGAGISTSAGIPDFRGPKGVWTLEAKGEKPDLNKDFNEAVPTVTHMAIMKLVEKEKVKYVVSQNIDGLHLRSNLPRKYLSELHGNMFTEQCSSCNRQFVRKTPVPTVGQKSLNKPCPVTKVNGRPCRGKLHDTILDWEHNLPENDLGMADYHSCLSDLSICLGTTMQIVPSGNLPLYTKKLGGRLVIVNLQPTKHDRKADLLIHAYVDDVMTMLMKNLGLKIPKYSAKNDPARSSEKLIEWTISDYAVKKMKKVYEEKCGAKEARKRLEILEDAFPLSITKTFKRKGKDDDDSDLEVLDVIVKPKKSKETSKRGSKKHGNTATPVYNTTITIKKVTAPPPSKKARYEPAEKITIKKNVTPTKTKYEIVTKPKKVPKCEIVYTDSDLCNDLDMICESDDDEMTNSFTYNFRRYLYEDVKKEEKTETAEEPKEEVKHEMKMEEDKDKEEMKSEEDKDKNEVKLEEDKEKKEVKIEEDKEEKEVKSEEDKEKNEVKLEEDTKEMKEGTVQENAAEEGFVESNDQNSEGEQRLQERPNEEATPDKENSIEGDNPLGSVSSVENGCEQENVNIQTPKEENEKTTAVPESPENLEESTPMEGDKADDPTKVPETPEEAPEKRDEGDKPAEESEEKAETIFRTVEPDVPSASNSLEKENEEMGTEECCGFDNSLSMTNSNINAGINENYEFYNSDFNSSNNPLEYVDNNYFSNF